MKWVSLNNSSYELWDNEKKLVSLSISSRTKIARIECAAEKRLFFIEKRGFLQSKTVIKNEYGIKLGELYGESWEANEGIIELDGKKYFYEFTHTSEPELIIYNDESKSKPLVSCSLSSVSEEAAAIVKKSKSLHDTKYPSLLMGLCWYLLKPAVKETLTETVAM